MLHATHALDGVTPLHDTAVQGCRTLVNLLAEAGALVNEPDHHGRMPCHRGARLDTGLLVKPISSWQHSASKPAPLSTKQINGVGHPCPGQLTTATDRS